MKIHPITINDIARELGVSVSTVTRALKDHPDISPRTKQRVYELVGKMKYKPDASALGLRNRPGNLIGVIVPEIVHHFFSSVISGIDETAIAAGYNVMFFQSNESYEREIMNIQSIINSKADGVLISLAKGTKKCDHIRQLLDLDIPVVFFDRYCEEIETDKVIVDDFEGAFKAVDYLIKTGCRRIAHFAGHQHLQIGYLRKQGYISALKKNGLEVDEDLIIPCDSYEDSLKITRILMSRLPPPDAIFTVNDMTAVASLVTVKSMGFHIPKEVSIIGFSDGLVSSITDPLLTTISQHGFEIGRKATEILIKRMKKEYDTFKPITEIIKTDLVVRHSTRKI